MDGFIEIEIGNFELRSFDVGSENQTRFERFFSITIHAANLTPGCEEIKSTDCHSYPPTVFGIEIDRCCGRLMQKSQAGVQLVH